jgi:hypothetical protein
LIAAIVASLFVVAIGWPLAAALSTLAGRGDDLPCRLGESVLLGSGLAALTLLLESLALPWSRPAAIVPPLLIAIGCAVFARGQLRAALTWRPSLAGAVDLVTAVLVLGYARFATLASSPEADFVTIWGVKARRFLTAGGIDWRFLENPFNEFAHVDYPVLVPLLFDVHSLVAGAWADRWLGLVNVLFGIATLLLVRSFLGEEVRSPLLRALATLAVVSCALSPWLGLAEGALVAYGTGGLLYLRRAVHHGVPADALRGAIYLGLGAACKNEGLTLIVAAGLAFLAAGAWRLARHLWPAPAIALPWLLLRSLHGLHTDLASGGISSRLRDHLAHAGTILTAMLQYSLGRPLFWIGILLALALGARDLVRRERFLALALLIQLLFFISAYLVTPHDVTWHVRWSWERIVSQLTTALTFLAVVVAARSLAAEQDPPRQPEPGGSVTTASGI